VRLVPRLWDRSDLVALSHADDTIKEYRGPETGSLIFDVRVLEANENAKGSYLHVSVCVSDTVRAYPHTGNSRIPLCTTFLWYANGELDMPDPEETARWLAAS
jgi:hypothetical protein